MATIGIRELRQHASVHVELARQGQTLTVTDRGEPVAVLGPLSPLERALAQALARHTLVPPSRPRRRFATTARLAGPPLSSDVDADRAERDLW